MNKFILVVVAFLFIAQSALAASPPWYRAAALLRKTIGASACFQVGKPELPTDGTRTYVITILACSDAAGRGLAQVIKKDFGYVVIRIISPAGVAAANVVEEPSVDQLKEAFEAGLTQNPYYVAFHPRGGFSNVTVEFKREVVQLFTDNLADLYGNSNYVAADAFSQVLGLQYGKLKVGTTTARN
ncbi:MAG: hypothetical protein HY074_13375 [Deltaproteobacteria bacterium]|nr:hypothetical protein [Deltaproteobacteria bacterium]